MTKNTHVVLVCILLILWCVPNCLLAQNVENSAQQDGRPAPPFITLEFALRAPNFNNSDDVSRHAAFSIVLAKLLFIEISGVARCELSTEVDFPDLRMRIMTNEKVSDTELGKCVNRVASVLMEEAFGRGEFNFAVQYARKTYTPLSLGDKDYTRPDLSIYRLPVVGRKALQELYRSDTVVSSLLAIHHRLETLQDEYEDFLAWLDGQRQSGRMGFYNPNDDNAGRLRKLNTLESPPSVRPLLKLTDPSLIEIHVDVGHVGGRATVLIRCAFESDRLCYYKLMRKVCSKPIASLLAPSETIADHSEANVRCAVLVVLGIGWLLLECDDELALKELKDGLAKENLAGPNSNERFEYFIWIDTK